MLGVMHVASHLGRKFNADIDLIENSSMIHDIGKVFDNSPTGHTLTGCRFLSKMGISKKIIQIVKCHQAWSFQSDERPEPTTDEEEIVFLGDLMFSNHIISPVRRVEDLINRYELEVENAAWLRNKLVYLVNKFSLRGG